MINDISAGVLLIGILLLWFMFFFAVVPNYYDKMKRLDEEHRALLEQYKEKEQQ